MTEVEELTNEEWSQGGVVSGSSRVRVRAIRYRYIRHECGDTCLGGKTSTGMNTHLRVFIIHVTALRLRIGNDSGNYIATRLSLIQSMHYLLNLPGDIKNSRSLPKVLFDKWHDAVLVPFLLIS